LAGVEGAAVWNEKSRSTCAKRRRDNITESELSQCREKSLMSKLW
jgi:hypothetical protein